MTLLFLNFFLKEKLLHLDILQTTKLPKIPICLDLTGTIRERGSNEDVAAEKMTCQRF